MLANMRKRTAVPDALIFSHLDYLAMAAKSRMQTSQPAQQRLITDLLQHPLWRSTRESGKWV
jgi:hypothetical protein